MRDARGGGGGFDSRDYSHYDVHKRDDADCIFQTSQESRIVNSKLFLALHSCYSTGILAG